MISGSVLDGRTAQGDVHGYLGRYHQQIAVVPEGGERELFGYIAPGANKFSIWGVVLGHWAKARPLALTTTTNGSPRAMVPIGAYERVLPMDLMPTFLLRALHHAQRRVGGGARRARARRGGCRALHVRLPGQGRVRTAAARCAHANREGARPRMKALRTLLDRVGRNFEKGGRLERFHPFWEAADTFFYSPGSVTKGGAHVRDALDLKRMMMTVVIATLPCVYMALYNTGLQANLALDPAKLASLTDWRHDVIRWLGVGFSPDSMTACIVHGALYFLPLYVVTMVVGLSWEVLFAVVRRLEVNEGFFVTGILFPLILPPTTPLWQAALGISFGVVLGKEVFGGTGMNFVNPALAARAFLFFAYPADISGDKVWTAIPPDAAVDGFSRRDGAGPDAADDRPVRAISPSPG